MALFSFLLSLFSRRVFRPIKSVIFHEVTAARIYIEANATCGLYTSDICFEVNYYIFFFLRDVGREELRMNADFNCRFYYFQPS